MHINFEMTDEILIASLDGELDHHSSGEMRVEIDKTIDAFQCKYLIFNFEKVSFMDSSGIGVIMGRYNKIKELGGKVFVVECSQYIDRILSMAGIYTIVPKYAKVDPVIKMIKGEIEVEQKIEEVR